MVKVVRMHLKLCGGGSADVDEKEVFEGGGRRVKVMRVYGSDSDGLNIVPESVYRW